jgi:hypothetical protein
VILVQVEVVLTGCFINGDVDGDDGACTGGVGRGEGDRRHHETGMLDLVVVVETIIIFMVILELMLVVGWLVVQVVVLVRVDASTTSVIISSMIATKDSMSEAIISNGIMDMN